MTTWRLDIEEEAQAYPVEAFGDPTECEDCPVEGFAYRLEVADLDDGPVDMHLLVNGDELAAVWVGRWYSQYENLRWRIQYDRGLAS